MAGLLAEKPVNFRFCLRQQAVAMSVAPIMEVKEMSRQAA